MALQESEKSFASASRRRSMDGASSHGSASTQTIGDGDGAVAGTGLAETYLWGKTGIAFSGTVGAALFVTSGQLIGISGSLGYVVSYICAALIVTGVMRSLAEMVSVRPVSGALMDFPHTFIDPALGFAVGVIYWLVSQDLKKKIVNDAV